MPQDKRGEAMTSFSNSDVDVLCSTDVASRGLDVDGIETVINMHMPSEFKIYVHRVGRRLGWKSGKVYFSYW